MKRKATLFLAMFMVLFSIVACGPAANNPAVTESPSASGGAKESNTPEAKPQEKVTLRFVNYGAAKAELFGKIVDGFNSSQSNIQVDFTTNTQNYFAQLKTQLSTGEAPDIFTHIIGMSMAPYVDAEHLMDITNEPYMEKLQPSSLQGSTYKGKVYAIPLDAQTFGVYYNKDIFAKNGFEIPKTYSELVALVDKMNAANITPFAVNYREKWTLGQMATIAYSPLAIPEFEKKQDSFYKGDWTFDTANFNQLLNAVDLIVKNAQDRAIDTDLSGQYALFAEGKTAMMPTGNWAIPQIRKIAPDLNAGMFPMPVSENAAENKYAVDYALCLNVLADTKHPEAVREFITYFLDSKGATSFYYDSIGVPTALKESSDKLDSISESLAQAMKDGNTVRWFQTVLPQGYDGEVWTSIQEYAASGSTDHKALIKKLDDTFIQMTK